MKLFKKPLFWVQKALDVVGVRTALPNHVDELVRPQIDALGWDMLREILSAIVSNPTAATVSSAACPEGVSRLVISAACYHGDTGNTHDLWITKQTDPRIGTSPTGVETVVSNPFGQVVPATVRIGLLRPVLLQQGDILKGNAEAALAAGSLVIVTHYVDLQQGEYVPGVSIQA